MKILTGLVLVLLSVLSCQRQLYFDEKPSEGFLKKDVGGNCVPIVVGGMVKNGKELADTNFIEVEVEVTNRGTYTISTDTLNGFWFSARSKFESTGSHRVKLIGKGKPTNAGNAQFAVRFNSSYCSASVAVLDQVQASFSFLGAPNDCRNAIIEGVYTRGVLVNNSNKVKVEVYVTSPGAYTITTNSVNGFQFSASGSMPDYGNYTVELSGSGTPANPGTHVFTVSTGASTCTFPITVVGGSPGGSLNHFPLTGNSRWTYVDLYHANDTVKRKISDSLLINGNFYKIIDESTWDSNSKYYCRRSANDYFEYGSVDKYTKVVTFNPQVKADIPFLKEGLFNGASWYSPVYTGTDGFGQTIQLRYSYVCTLNSAVATINGITFSQNYRIIMRPQTAPVGGLFAFTGEAYEYYYANGIGLVQMTNTLNGYPQMVWDIRSWDVY